jgi:type III secretory pathway component EscU
MGFYYNSGQDPQDEDGGWRETFAIILVVFRILAKPLGFMLGAIIGLVMIIWLFSITPLLGLGALAAVVLAIVLRGVWEAKHPPELP